MLLANVQGQTRALGLLRRAIDSRRLAHTYLFEGPDSTGKRSTAIALGLALLCPVRPGHGCGTCPDCQRAARGLHPDLRLVVPDGPQIKIDTAHELVALAGEPPHEAPVRLIVLDEADRLNLSAANCLLKILEEPARGNHFVLVTAQRERLLPTIRSRAQRVRFDALPAMIVQEILRALPPEGPAPAEADLALAAALADGSVARAREVLQTLTGSEAEGGPRALAAALRTAAHRRDAGAMLDVVAGLSGTREQRERLGATLDLLARLYRDALVSAAGAPELVVLGEAGASVAALAEAARGAHALAPLRKALAAVQEATAAVAGNVAPALAIHVLMFRLAALESRAAVPARG